jgi:tripartite-type tricarboxylate transporter receptor subunit TctC
MSLPSVPESRRTKKIYRGNTTMRISANKRAWLLGALVIGSAAWVPHACAQSYPSHNITAIIPFAAGNANDITARIVLEQVGRQMGQAIIIDNRGGAGGTIGVGQAARATPDGYTILFHSASFSSAYVTHKTLPYDTFKDFIAVAPVGISPSVLVVSPSKGYKTAADLIAAAKARPGEMNFASAGIGAASHLAAEKFNVAAGIKAQHVPFKGPVEALTEVMAGRIDYYFLPIAPALSLIKDGKVTALAVSSNTRAPSLPDVPTTAEIGLPKAAYAFWNGVFVPAKTPQDVVTRLYDETKKAVADPGVRERFTQLGIAPLSMSQPEFQKYFEDDVKDTEALAKAAGIERQ